MTEIVRTCLVGAGLMARAHLGVMLENGAEVRAICEPSEAAYKETCEKLTELGAAIPPNEPDLKKLLDQYGDELDAAFIITPHAFHFDQATLCMEAGLDVLLEKPMVVNAQEAKSLIATRDRTERLLVVAFQGGLSPQIREAARLLRSGEVGELLNIQASTWQNWRELSVNTWRVIPELSGGGFLFDTGAHVLNTVCDILGEDFAQVSAFLDNRGEDVDILGAAVGRTESGVLVTINACGDTIATCESDIMIFCTNAIIRTGMWGERLQIRPAGESDFNDVDLPPMVGAWEQFMQVRKGEIENPCPPEVGLRMVKLWDAIRLSASQDGKAVLV